MFRKIIKGDWESIFDLIEDYDMRLIAPDINLEKFTENSFRIVITEIPKSELLTVLSGLDKKIKNSGFEVVSITKQEFLLTVAESRKDHIYDLKNDLRKLGLGWYVGR